MSHNSFMGHALIYNAQKGFGIVEKEKTKQQQQLFMQPIHTNKMEKLKTL